MITLLMLLPPILKIKKNSPVDLTIIQSKFGMHQLSSAKLPSKVTKKVFGLFHMIIPVRNYLHHHQISPQEFGILKQENKQQS